MKKQFLSFLFLIFCFSNVFGQAKEAQKFDEFGRIQCGEFMARMDTIYQAFRDAADSKIYIIYYEDNGMQYTVWNKKLKKNEIKRRAPIRGSALNLAKAIPFYLIKMRKLSPKDFVFIDGGFRESFANEIWIVPNGAEKPQPTPTVAAESVRFSTLKPRRTPDFTGCYEGYE
jgi:hypothetical protein